MQGDNRGFLVVIVILLVAILGVIVSQNYRPRTPAQKLGDSVSEVVEEIHDEVDDHTTSN